MITIKQADLVRRIAMGDRIFRPTDTGERHADLERFQELALELETLSAAGFIDGFVPHHESATGKSLGGSCTS